MTDIDLHLMPTLALRAAGDAEAQRTGIAREARVDVAEGRVVAGGTAALVEVLGAKLRSHGIGQPRIELGLRIAIAGTERAVVERERFAAAIGAVFGGLARQQPQGPDIGQLVPRLQAPRIGTGLLALRGGRTVGGRVEVCAVALRPGRQSDRRGVAQPLLDPQHAAALAVAVEIGIGAGRERPRYDLRGINRRERLAAARGGGGRQPRLPEGPAGAEAAAGGRAAARLGTHHNLVALRGAAREDLDHATDGLGAVQARQVAAHDLDAIDGVDADAAERGKAAGRGVQPHAVDQHQQLSAAGAAREHRGLAAGAAASHELQSGLPAQQFDQFGGLHALEIGARQHRDRRQRLVKLLLDPGAADHHGRERCRLRQHRGGKDAGRR